MQFWSMFFSTKKLALPTILCFLSGLIMLVSASALKLNIPIPVMNKITFVFMIIVFTMVRSQQIKKIIKDYELKINRKKKENKQE